MKSYVPHKGDFVIITFDPQSGHEQKGRRPALVVSNDLFNQHTGLAVVCPVTHTNRNIPFHVSIEGCGITGYVMVEQMKSIDYGSRGMKFVEKAPAKIINEVLSLLESCVL